MSRARRLVLFHQRSTHGAAGIGCSSAEQSLPDANSKVCSRAGRPFRLHAKTIRSPARASASGRTISGRCSAVEVGRDRPRVEQALAVVDAVVPRQFERLALERHVLGETC